MGTYTAPKTEEAVLKKFYRTVRPWGFWEPIRQKVMAEDPLFSPNKNFRRDMINVALGIIAQCCLTILPMYFVLWEVGPLLMTVLLLVVLVIVLHTTWWKQLEN